MGEIVKAELTFPLELVELIADRVIEKLKPLLQPQQADDEILSLDDASKLMGNSKDQIYQWVNNSKHGLGTFPYMKAGRSLRFSKNAVLQWMKTSAKRLEGR
jgi:excisionase family DNA binding protein